MALHPYFLQRTFPCNALITPKESCTVQQYFLLCRRSAKKLYCKLYVCSNKQFRVCRIFIIIIVFFLLIISRQPWKTSKSPDRQQDQVKKYPKTMRWIMCMQPKKEIFTRVLGNGIVIYSLVSLPHALHSLYKKMVMMIIVKWEMEYYTISWESFSKKFMKIVWRVHNVQGNAQKDRFPGLWIVHQNSRNKLRSTDHLLLFLGLLHRKKLEYRGIDTCSRVQFTKPICLD